MEVNQVLSAIFTLVMIILMTIIVSNMVCKSGRGVGIMHGSVNDYRYIEVPSELKLQSVEYEFTPSKGDVHVKWESRNSK